MTYRQARAVLAGGLDRWCAGHTELLRDTHRWITAREANERRWHAIAVRHGGALGGSVLLVSVGGLPVAAAGTAWAVAAWRRAPEAPEPPEPADVRREAYLRLLAAVIGDRTGVHLAELYTTLRRYPHWTAWPDDQMRALLDNLGVPVRRTMRVGDVTGRSGIRLADVHARMTGVPVPRPAVIANPSPGSEEAGHSDVERDVEGHVDGAVEPVDIVVSNPESEPLWITPSPQVRQRN